MKCACGLLSIRAGHDDNCGSGFHFREGCSCARVRLGGPLTGSRGPRPHEQKAFPARMNGLTGL